MFHIHTLIKDISCCLLHNINCLCLCLCRFSVFKKFRNNTTLTGLSQNSLKQVWVDNNSLSVCLIMTVCLSNHEYLSVCQSNLMKVSLYFFFVLLYFSLYYLNSQDIMDCTRKELETKLMAVLYFIEHPSLPSSLFVTSTSEWIMCQSWIEIMLQCLLYFALNTKTAAYASIQLCVLSILTYSSIKSEGTSSYYSWCHCLLKLTNSRKNSWPMESMVNQQTKSG